MRERNSRRRAKPVLDSPSEQEGSNEDVDEIESVVSGDEPEEGQESMGLEEEPEEVNDLVESVDLTLVVWLREMYCKYNQPYLTCLDCLEHSNYTTKLAEELLMSRFGAKKAGRPLSESSVCK
ncbi:hypothetical protein OIY81_2563 [Cryptosporidium canis]|uniref:Uncharacterized protein n=1 Tax=Cryptosporidium canis TaxID=195482 RepID=A0ABQ8P630_9CRYT|nr:hypothetical protein OIY81_2563 [Cryptosporidium canis]KAJ1609642.1 hypothetical protein OJ252_2128 [Cryptosporidium canis]